MRFIRKRKLYNINVESKVIFSLIVLGLFLVISNSIKAQAKETYSYWFVAPDASNKHAQSDRPTFFMIVTDNRPATVNISMPANTDFTPVTKEIGANSYYQHIFTTDSEINLIENSYKSSAIVTSKGILIESSVPVSIYYQIDGPNQKEIFSLKGDRALGNEFYIPMQDKYSNNTINSSYEDGYRQIQIVATEDNTLVTFNCTDVVADGASSSIAVNSSTSRILSKGQTLLLRGYERKTNLKGAHIKSDKAIAVTVFEDCITTKGSSGISGGTDPIGDQIVPIDQLGKNYIIVKGYSSGQAVDLVTIVAIKDNTTYKLIRAENSQEMALDTLAKGESKTIDIGNSTTAPLAIILKASEPVYCMHTSAGGGEIGGALLPSLYSIAARRIGFMNGSLDTNSLFLIFRESAKNGFTIDGEPLNVSALSVNYDGWMYAKHNLKKESEAHKYTTIQNSDGPFSMGYFLGNNNSSLYGYFSDFGTFSFGTSDTIYHCGNTYNFDAGYALNYEWILPDGTVKTEASFTTSQSGLYKVKVDQDPYTITDSVYLKLQNFSHTLNLPVGTAFFVGLVKSGE